QVPAVGRIRFAGPAEHDEGRRTGRDLRGVVQGAGRPWGGALPLGRLDDVVHGRGRGSKAPPAGGGGPERGGGRHPPAPCPRGAETRSAVACANGRICSPRSLNVRSLSSTRSHLLAATAMARPASITRRAIRLSSEVSPSAASSTTTTT